MNLVIQLIGGNPESKLTLNTFGGLWDGFDLLLGTNDRLGLDSGNVLGVSPGQEAVVILGKGNQDALLDKVVFDHFVLAVTSIHDVEAIRLTHRDVLGGPLPNDFGNPHPVAIDDLDGANIGVARGTSTRHHLKNFGLFQLSQTPTTAIKNIFCSKCSRQEGTFFLHYASVTTLQ